MLLRSCCYLRWCIGPGATVVGLVHSVVCTHMRQMSTSSVCLRHDPFYFRVEVQTSLGLESCTWPEVRTYRATDHLFEGFEDLWMIDERTYLPSSLLEVTKCRTIRAGSLLEYPIEMSCPGVELTRLVAGGGFSKSRSANNPKWPDITRWLNPCVRSSMPLGSAWSAALV